MAKLWRNQKKQFIRILSPTKTNNNKENNMKTSFKDKRTSHLLRELTDNDRSVVIQDIVYIPTQESHYSRSQNHQRLSKF